MQRAIEIMRAEHRTLGAALHALVSIVDDMIRRDCSPDFHLLETLLGYIDQFPDQFHHPKEDQYLFRLLRLRAPEIERLLSALEEEHRINRNLMEGLGFALAALRIHPTQKATQLRLQKLIRNYAEFHWSHMRLEEEQVFPMAEKHLTPEDWVTLNAAFESNRDPLFGVAAKEHYDELLRRIVQQAPEPIGLGQRWH